MLSFLKNKREKKKNKTSLKRNEQQMMQAMQTQLEGLLIENKKIHRCLNKLHNQLLIQHI